MIPEIFDIENGQVIINHNCLSIPELKAVNEKYKNPIPAFNFLHYLNSPKGPYCNVPEEDKEEVLLGDFPGEYTLEDDVMIKAIDRLSVFIDTPSYRYYLDHKFLMEKLGKFARNATISSGRDGNLTALGAQLKSVGKTVQEFKILEKTVLQELEEGSARARGGKRIAYDQQR
jgi:hypothetical protein